MATGKHEFNKKLKRQGLEDSAIAFKMHYRLNENAEKKLQQKINLFFFKQAYGGLSFIENSIANFCFIISKKEFRKLGNTYEAALNSLQFQNSILAELLNESCSLWKKPLAMSGIPYGYLSGKPKSKSEEGVFYLGDQFAVIPSLTGRGMAIALYTARQEVEHYHQKRNKGLQLYQQESYERIRSRMRLAYPFHALTRFPALADLAVAFLKYLPPLTEYLIQKTRMPAL